MFEFNQVIWVAIAAAGYLPLAALIGAVVFIGSVAAAWRSASYLGGNHE